MDGNKLHITWQTKRENYEGNPISYNLLRSKRLVEGVNAPVACEIIPAGTECTYVIDGDPASVESFYSIEANP